MVVVEEEVGAEVVEGERLVQWMISEDLSARAADELFCKLFILLTG